MSYKEEKYIDSAGQELIKTTWNNGFVEYTNKQGKYHRLDGPAVIMSRDYKAWYKNGHYHREDAPAIIYYSGKEEYWLKGKQVSKRDLDIFWLKKQVEK